MSRLSDALKPARRRVFSPLCMGAGRRLAMALAVLGGLWLVVLWALETP